MLTGKTRHRRTIFGKMVLQVEYVDTNPKPESEGKYNWMDARDIDLWELMRMGAIPYCYPPPLPPETNQA